MACAGCVPYPCSTCAHEDGSQGAPPIVKWKGKRKRKQCANSHNRNSGNGQCWKVPYTRLKEVNDRQCPYYPGQLAIIGVEISEGGFCSGTNHRIKHYHAVHATCFQIPGLSYGNSSEFNVSITSQEAIQREVISHNLDSCCSLHVGITTCHN